VFGYGYFEDKAKAAGIATPKLLRFEALLGSDEEYAYRTLDFADGKRNAQQIRHRIAESAGEDWRRRGGEVGEQRMNERFLASLGMTVFGQRRSSKII